MQSICGQTYSNLEIILVDDGSPDGCPALCDAWAQRDCRIRVVHKENGGLSSARNAGLDIMTGKYVMFVDSDDVLDREICRHLYHILIADDGDIAICEPVHVFPGETPAFTHNTQSESYEPDGAICQMWYQRSFLPSAWAKLYKAEFFQTLRFTQGILYEDIDVMHLVFCQAKKIIYTPAELYGYMHREGSITTTAFRLRDLDILKIADKILCFAKQTAPQLLPAAKAYSVVAALRVVLNAPDTAAFAQGHHQAKTLLKQYGKEVLRDANIRKKTRYGLLLYFYCRPLMKMIYKRINRWK